MPAETTPTTLRDREPEMDSWPQTNDSYPEPDGRQSSEYHRGWNAAFAALSERGYTIVASDRLAGLEKLADSAARWVAANARKRQYVDHDGSLEQDRWQAESSLVATLSRSEATEKGAPRE